MTDAPRHEPTEGRTGDEQTAAGAPPSGAAHDPPAASPESAAPEPVVDEQAAPGEGAEATSAAGARGAAPDGGTADGVDPDVSFETLVSDLERVATERDEFLDAYRRAQADFDNYRKQAARRHEEQVARSVGNLVEALLPVLDACDAAIGHGVTEVEPIASALLGTLEREGLQRIDPKGEPFDPTVAEAVVHEPGGGGEHIVAEVMRAGYAWHGKVLRPAMVKVTD